MCANPMCANFGFLYGSEDEPGDDEARFRVSDGDPLTLVCRNCGYSPKLHAPLSIRPLARHFLAQSLPFADCPKEECANHGVNVFEYLGKRVGSQRSPYRQIGAHRLACRECEREKRAKPAFPIGTALGLSASSKSVRENVAKQITAAWEADSVTRTLSETARQDGRKKRKIRHVGSYYRRLFAMASQVRDYAAWRNAYLLSPEFGALQTSPVEVHTDVLELSLHRIGDGPSHKVLKIIASVVNLRRFRTHFLLAAHPYFLPDDKCPDLGALEEDKEYTRFLARRWEGLETALDDRDLVKDGKIAKDPPTHGYDGHLLRSPYAEVAHFLTVDRMLSRFPRRHYYMDGDRAQYQAALVAMRRQIRDRSVDIALFQHRKKSDSRAGDQPPNHPRGRQRRDKPRLRRQFKAMEKRFGKKLRVSSGSLDEDTRALAMAKVWRSAFRGARHAQGSWAWLHYPPGTGHYADCRTLWLTRRPGEGLDEGFDLLLNATLQAVDGNFAYMRYRINSANRPSTSTGGQSYVASSYDPRVVCAEFSMYLFLRNYFRRPAAEEKHIRAEVMGLIPRDRPVLSPEQAVWSFRLGMKHAREMVRWLGRP